MGRKNQTINFWNVFLLATEKELKQAELIANELTSN